MVVVYGYKVDIKNEKSLGEEKCPNCNHVAKMYLSKEQFKANIFYIPVFKKTNRRIVLCENCGIVEELNKEEYNSRLKEL